MPYVVRLRVLAKRVCAKAGRLKVEVIFVKEIRSGFVYYLNDIK